MVRKTAQRLVIELKEKISKHITETDVNILATGGVEAGKSGEAVLAMVSLGYQKSMAERTVMQLLNKEPDLTLDELIKKALQKV